MSRKRMRRGRDRRKFRQTASRSKKINITPKSYRGGIRL